MTAPCVCTVARACEQVMDNGLNRDMAKEGEAIEAHATASKIVLIEGSSSILHALTA